MAVSLHPQQASPFSGPLPTKAADTGKCLPGVSWKWALLPYIQVRRLFFFLQSGLLRPLSSTLAFSPGVRS